MVLDGISWNNGDTALTAPVAPRASEHQIRWWWVETGSRNDGCQEDLALGGPNNTHAPSLCHERCHRIPTGFGQQGCVGRHQGERDLKDIDLGSSRHFHPERQEDLGNDEGCPHLLVEDGWLPAPQAMES